MPCTCSCPGIRRCSAYARSRAMTMGPRSSCPTPLRGPTVSSITLFQEKNMTINQDPGAANDSAVLARRQQWMRVLARAGAQLSRYDDALRQHEYRYIRPAEIGMVMVRGRAGASGAAFNLGEMTVTRCVVQLADGRHGYGYVAGRS